MKVEDFYAPFWETDPELLEAAPPAYAANLKASLGAIREYEKKDRPLRVLAIHASGRWPSTSATLLQAGLKRVRREGVEVQELRLFEHRIEPCRNCVSIASAFCGFPCDCYPHDPMQAIYPKILRSDVLLFSTGVNQTAMGSRLKLLVDRLVSLDGGFRRSEWRPKQEFLEGAIEFSRAGEFEYTQRLHGRVCAYFIASKDEKNPASEGFSYIDHVATTLYQGFDDYGCFHAEPWLASWAARPDEEYSYDLERVEKDEMALARARLVVEAALDLAVELREEMPEPEAGRVNRT